MANNFTKCMFYMNLVSKRIQYEGFLYIFATHMPSLRDILNNEALSFSCNLK